MLNVLIFPLPDDAEIQNLCGICEKRAVLFIVINGWKKVVAAGGKGQGSAGLNHSQLLPS